MGEAKQKKIAEAERREKRKHLLKALFYSLTLPIWFFPFAMWFFFKETMKDGKAPWESP